MKKSKPTTILFTSIIAVFLMTDLVSASDDSWVDQGSNVVTTNPGNVGIGTTTPQGKLHIEGGFLYFDDYENNILFDGGQVRITTHDGHGNWQIKQGADNDDKYVSQGKGAIKFRMDENGYTYLYSAGAGNLGNIIPWNLGFLQSSNGNVGIGASNPQARLHIKNGHLLFDDGENNILFDGGQVRITTHDGYGNWQIKQGADNNDKYVGQGTGAVKFRMDENGYTYLFSAGAGNLGNIIPWKLGFIQSPDGNVGIGTTSPNNKLDVKGTIRAEEVVVATGWSDFVFAEGYDLRSLDFVENYINENKHLPDIPSAKEVKENGLSMAQMMAKQMQKIEELTLYLIELKKENEELKGRVTALERNN